MAKDHGEPIRYDPDFNGPIHNRSCTDIIWLIIFILFLGGWGYVGYYSMTRGDIEKLLAPIDSEGRRCGLDSQVEDKKYLVFYDITKCLQPGTAITGCPTPQVCVKECPTTTIPIEAQLRADANNIGQLRSSMVCRYNVTISNSMSAEQALNLIETQMCASYVVKSAPVMGRCFPDVSEAVNMIEEFAGPSVESWAQGAAHIVAFEQLSAQIVQDLTQSRWYLVGALISVVIICFLYILLLRWVVGPVVWLSIVGLLALLVYGTYVCYTQYTYFTQNPTNTYQTTNLRGYMQSIFAKAETWLVLLVVIAIIVVVLALMVIFLRKRITIAIALIREGSKAVTAVKSTMFFPLFPWVLQCLTLAYAVLVLMYLVSIGDSAFRVVNMANDTSCSCSGKYQDEMACNPLEFTASCFDRSASGVRPCQFAICHFTGIDNPHNIIYLHLVNVFGFFWTMFFISGVADMMLASTFATWYWTFDKRKVPFFTLTSGMYRTVRYHLGTVAFGSLIIAIVRFIRFFLEYIDHKLKKFDNAFTRALLCCCKCFFWCLENFLKFINKNAYIMCAVHGKSFCSSARDAFSLLMRNIVRVFVLDKVMDFIFFLSKLLISVGVGLAVYYILNWNFVYDITQGERLHYNYIPAIILGIATYFICTIFFNVYAMAVDTLFLCFLEDSERNDGSPEKQFFMSKNLMSILGKRNKTQ